MSTGLLHGSHLVATGYPAWPSIAVHAAASWAWRASWQAAVLAGLVLIIRWALGPRLNARARSALWWIVLARLLMPPLPLHRPAVWRPLDRPPVAPTALPADGNMRTVANVNGDHPLTNSSQLTSKVDVALNTAAAITKEPNPIDTPPPSRVSQAARLSQPRAALRMAFDWRQWFRALLDWLPWVWAAGAIALLARLAATAFRITRRLRRLPPLQDQAVARALDQCATDLRLRRLPRMLATDGPGGPAVAGILRPALLIPAGVAARLSPEELRLVLLHELFHIKRRDLPFTWFLSAIAAIHWANPLLVWAIRQMRRDLELACDESVIAADATGSGAGSNHTYGSMLLRMAEAFSASGARPWADPVCPAVIPAPAGVLPAFQSARELDRRIAMALRFSPSHSTWPAAAVCGGLLLAAGVLLVDAAEPMAPPTAAHAAPIPSPATTTTGGQIPVLSELPYVGRLFRLPPSRGAAAAEPVDPNSAGSPAPAVTAPQASPADADAENVRQGQLDVLRARLAAKKAEVEAATEAMKAADELKAGHAISRVDLLQARATLARLQADQIELEWQYKSLTANSPAPTAAAPAPLPVPASIPGAGPAPGVSSPVPAVPTPQQPSPVDSPVIETEAEHAADAAVEAKLDKPLSEVSFDQVPMNEAINFLRDQTGVSFFVDSGALTQGSDPLLVPVTLRAKDMPAAVVIDRLLRSTAPGGDRLGYVIDHGQVFISTNEQLGKMLVTRSYDVSDLSDNRDLIKLVQTFVAPDSWQQNGGSVGRIEQFGHQLIVTQSRPNFRQLDRFLSLLRARASQTTTKSTTTTPKTAEPAPSPPPITPPVPTLPPS